MAERRYFGEAGKERSRCTMIYSHNWGVHVGPEHTAEISMDAALLRRQLRRPTHALRPRAGREPVFGPDLIIGQRQGRCLRGLHLPAHRGHQPGRRSPQQPGQMPHRVPRLRHPRQRRPAGRQAPHRQPPTPTTPSPISSACAPRIPTAAAAGSTPRRPDHSCQRQHRRQHPRRSLLPVRPSDVSLTRADGTVTASWDAPGGASKYHITYSSNNQAELEPGRL